MNGDSSALLQRVFESNFVGRRCVIKERFSKKYRHPTLDAKLTLKRLNAVSSMVTKLVLLPIWCFLLLVKVIGERNF